MSKEQILLDALNEAGNFTMVSQEFNEAQLGAIYKAMDVVKKLTTPPEDCKHEHTCGLDPCNLDECPEYEKKTNEVSVCDDFMSNFSDINICLWCEHTKGEHR